MITVSEAQVHQIITDGPENRAGCYISEILFLKRGWVPSTAPVTPIKLSRIGNGAKYAERQNSTA